MAKKFFYVCAGLMCLGLAFHLGAGTAHGQFATADASMIDGNGAAAVIGRQVSYFGFGNAPVHIPEPVPGSSRVMACNYTLVLLENGDAYEYMRDSGVWVFRGTLGLGPTPTTQSSWGALKANSR